MVRTILDAAKVSQDALDAALDLAAGGTNAKVKKRLLTSGRCKAASARLRSRSQGLGRAWLRKYRAT